MRGQEPVRRQKSLRRKDIWREKDDGKPVRCEESVCSEKPLRRKVTNVNGTQEDRK